MSHQTGASLPASRQGKAPFLLFVALFILGATGVASLLLILPDMAGVPRPLLLLNPSILLIIGTFLGIILTGRLGWRSAIADLINRQPTSFRVGTTAKVLLVSIIGGCVIAIADQLLRPLWQTSSAATSMVDAWSPAALLVGVLYGGITEEIMFRWGMLSLVVWGLWKLIARREASPSPAIVWLGIVVTAVLFGLGHLPALQLSGAELTTGLVIRTVGFNMLVSMLFAWMFVRHNLETAMFAHAGFHLGLALAVLIV
jgi:membrane protease YdiL (CAAX protease family)